MDPRKFSLDFIQSSSRTQPNPMTKELVEFADNSDSASVNRLLALSEIVKNIPEEKMKKVKSLNVVWVALSDELVPDLKMEFFE